MQTVSASIYLSFEERKALLKKDDWRAGMGIIYQWALLIFAFAISYLFPHLITYIISVFIIGGRQLACAILVHDASHYSLFNNKKLNDIIGQWLGGHPIFHNVAKYRPYHLDHHQNNGLKEDPDLLLTRGYPTSLASMIRKITRDLTGLTGVKVLVGLIMMGMGYLEYNLGNKVVKSTPEDKSLKAFILRLRKTFLGPITFNLCIFSLLYLLASGWLYLLWVTAFFTTFQFSIRVRSIAEHSVVEDKANPILNTRTTKANLIEQILFAPYHVNYHAEHHMLMAVPPYNLPRMHQLIKDKGFYKKGVLAKSYWETIRKTVQ